MQRLLDLAANLIREAQRLEAPQALPKLQQALEALEGTPPSRERDGMLALVYLRLAQAHSRLGNTLEAERTYMTGYAYARTSREERVQRLAERLKSELAS